MMIYIKNYKHQYININIFYKIALISIKFLMKIDFSLF